MRFLIFTIVLFVSTNINAQIEPQYKDVFLRVYNKEYKKIAKGKLVLITDSSLVISKRRKQTEIFLKDIEKIRTKRSYGNSVLKGAAIGGGTLAILGAVAAPNEGSLLSLTPAEGFTIGTIAGGFYGAGIGAIVGIFKNSKVYMINGDASKLESFKKLVLTAKQ